MTVKELKPILETMISRFPTRSSQKSRDSQKQISQLVEATLLAMQNS